MDNIIEIHDICPITLKNTCNKDIECNDCMLFINTIEKFDNN